MPRKAPRPSVRFYCTPRAFEEEKTLRDNLAKAHVLAIRSIIPSLGLNDDDRKAMQKLLS